MGIANSGSGVEDIIDRVQFAMGDERLVIDGRKGLRVFYFCSNGHGQGVGSPK